MPFVENMEDIEGFTRFGRVSIFLLIRRLWVLIPPGAPCFVDVLWSWGETKKKIAMFDNNILVSRVLLLILSQIGLHSLEPDSICERLD